ncbi:PKD domain-containing protein [Neotamlana laminarinivorans]|uniref:PKD domain-containing protein n=1 Tax=Neotamlana laminarinivorans TaxID=2883124 RepID=A0A9X1I0C7_9FLAO|nr:PKD domain-containing protein [Tamlana laminarinivorans]MCB4799478.1 PKD domain-containing protein [Tamlana laminarinivorans]
MTYNINRKNIVGVFILALSLFMISCYDAGYEPFEAPTGNVNDIQPNTLFTTSTSADDNLTVVFRSYSTDAASYLWDFGDGNTSTEANPDYTYAEGGLYLVTLTTTSSDGLVAEASSEVSPISVDFSFTSIDSQVTFTNLSTGVASLVWDFGDGTTIDWAEEDTTDDPNYSPVYSYTTAETFQVTLTATNYLGVETSVTKNIEGLVLSTVPDFTFDVSSLTVDFTDASTLAVSHSWDFGDGNTSTEVNPSHTYAVAGTYDVTLITTNDAGVSRSITKPVPVGGIEASFKVIVQNSECNDHTATTGDNADAWDMTPNSTVIDDDLGEIESPYRALWNNSDLNAYIDANFCTNEQPGSTSDGNKFGPNAGGGRGVKISEACRRLYQLVAVEPGVEYTFTIDSRSEAAGISTEVFILNNEITTEDAINTEAERAINTDAYYVIDNDFNSSKSSSTDDTFTTTTFTFEATSNIAVIYVRALNAVDSSNEVFYDNIDIITPGF